MSGLFKTYQEVAREISEGMASGTVSLGWDETREDLASVAFVLFRFLSPTRLAITAAAAAEAPLMGPHTSLDAEISPEEYEWLPDEVKAEFEGKVKELRAKGIKVRIMPTHT